MNGDMQEMTLKQYVEQCPEGGRVRTEYDVLIHAQEWLFALQEAGVDNWEGCSHAHDLLTDRN